MSAQPAEVVEITQNAIAIDRMGGELLKALVDEVRLAPAQWSKLTELQQEQLISRLRQVVHVETEKALFLLAKGVREAARVKIESLTVKDGAKVVLQAQEKAAHDVLDYVGMSAVLVMCDPEQFFAGGDDVEPDADEPELPLDEGAADDPIAEVENEAETETTGDQ